MTEDHTDYSLSVRLIDSLVTPPMFKSAAGWITESKHLPEAFRPEPFLLAAVSSPLLQSGSFSCNRAGPHSRSISRPYWGCFVAPLPPSSWCHDQKHKGRVDELQTYRPAFTALMALLITVQIMMNSTRFVSSVNFYMNATHWRSVKLQSNCQ